MTVHVVLAHGQDDNNNEDNDSTHDAQGDRQPRERWIRIANSNTLRLQQERIYQFLCEVVSPPGRNKLCLGDTSCTDTHTLMVV